MGPRDTHTRVGEKNRIFDFFRTKTLGSFRKHHAGTIARPPRRLRARSVDPEATPRKQPRYGPPTVGLHAFGLHVPLVFVHL